MERNGKFVAGVFTSFGLYSTTIPRDSESKAITSVDGVGLKQSTDKSLLRTLELVFEIFSGQEVDLSQFDLDFSGLTTKQKRVAEAAMKIPHGTTMSYGEVAERAGFPGAARFVGNVMASNRHYPIVPCHRVVSSKGIGGYGPGVKMKIEFLRREGAFAD
ncbi:MAG: MGMT family protein [Candidatus Thorarchaeota archaeon]